MRFAHEYGEVGRSLERLREMNKGIVRVFRGESLEEAEKLLDGRIARHAGGGALQVVLDPLRVCGAGAEREAIHVPISLAAS
jgi:hypothetical protein